LVLGYNSGGIDISKTNIPEAFIAYAQNDEDVRVWHALKHIECPFYVEVGAQHPLLLSPTAALSALGWTGILIEPDATYADLLRKHRPNDAVIEAGASSAPGTMELFRFESTGLTTFSKEYVLLAAKRRFAPSAISRVPVRTLDEILTSSNAPTVHFLSIDVEGWEQEVLRGANLEKWRPWVVCVEAIEPGGDTYIGNGVKAFMESFEYVHCVFDGVNDWFVAVERPELISAIETGFSAIDSGKYGWRRAETVALETERAEILAMIDSADTVIARERKYLEAKRDLVVRARAMPAKILLHAEEDLGTSQIEPVIADESPAFERSNRHILLRKNTLRRVLRVLLPASVRRSRNARLTYRRFIVAHTASSFVAGKPIFSVNYSPDETRLLGSVIPRDVLAPGPISANTARELETFLATHPEDEDEQLVLRLDGRGDEVGAILSDLRCRLDLTGPREGELPILGAQILFDARSLQTAGFRDRGIGAFVSALLEVLLETVEHSRIVLFVDLFEAALPDEAYQGLVQVSSLNNLSMKDFALFVQPSPMTHDVAPLTGILVSGVPSLVIVYDFIPAEYPQVYLPSPSNQLRYATQVQALARYSTFLPISLSVEKSLHRWVPSSAGRSIPTWPRQLTVPAQAVTGSAQNKKDQIVVFGANEPRKNTLAALAGIEKATRSRALKPQIIIFGMARDEGLARHWVGLSGLSNLNVVVAAHLPKDQRDEILASSTLVLVPSFAEGLSLPVIESLNAGTPVVASRIDAHKELLGSGAHLAHPARTTEWARAIERALAQPQRLFRKQAQSFARQKKDTFDAVLPRILAPLGLLQQRPTEPARRESRRSTGVGTLPSIGIATPWPMQRSGISDFSLATLTALSHISDLTLYATSSARSEPNLTVRPLTAAYGASKSHEHTISVLGNSHFHIPILSFLRHSGGLVLAHDSKMVELYAAVRGERATDNLMNHSSRVEGTRLSYSDQVHGNSYGNLGYGEIAEISSAMVFHSSGAAARVNEETGKRTLVLPFVPLRSPLEGETLETRRTQARHTLGFTGESIHLISVGIIDSRSKLNDIILEASLWLRSWGHDVNLHFVGTDGQAPGMTQQLIERSREGGTGWFYVSGYVDESSMRHYLSAADIIVQLRTGNVPMLSAPVADAAAYGIPTLATALLVEDPALPSFVKAVGEAVSPLTLAEKLASMIGEADSSALRDAESRQYVARRNPAQYARALFEMLQEFS
jgi:FkbM family methyltransferase